jgi:hypothetical protein
VLRDESLGIRLIVLHVDPDELDQVAVGLERAVKQRRLGPARDAPGCPDVDHGRAVEPSQSCFELVDGHDREISDV